MKRRMLFVDDESNILDGLRRMLHGQRAEWDMRFAVGGEEALMRMQEQPAEVIISDMRMPGMDGAELLGRVRDLYPQAIRIVLSGQSDKEHVLRAVCVAHQYLSKPCDAETLRSVLRRACKLGQIMSDETLRRIVSQEATLPAVPAQYHQLVSELKSDRSSIQEIAAIVATDVAMTTKVLQLVNSSYFGLPRRISSPAEAVTYLGLSTLRSLTLSVNAFEAYGAGQLEGFSPEALMQHSLEVAALARVIAESEGASGAESEDAFLAGLLHDVGKLILAANCGEAFESSLAHAAASGVAPWRAEQETFGTTHAEVGAYLFGLWGLPETLIAAVAGHHSLAIEGDSAGQVGSWICAADALVHARHAGRAIDPDDFPDSPLKAALCERLPGYASVAGRPRKAA